MSALVRRIERLEGEISARYQLPVVAVSCPDGRVIWNGQTYSSKSELGTALKTAKADLPLIIIAKRG